MDKSEQDSISNPAASNLKRAAHIKSKNTRRFVLRNEIDSDGDPIESLVALTSDLKPICFSKRDKDRDPYLFYPEDPIKAYWDIFIMIVLIFACLV